MSDQLTAFAHQLVDIIRDKTVRPLLIGVRGITIGLLVLSITLLVATATIIGLARLFDVSVFHGRVWATDLLFGAIFLIIGLLLMRRITPRKHTDARR